MCACDLQEKKRAARKAAQALNAKESPYTIEWRLPRVDFDGGAERYGPNAFNAALVPYFEVTHHIKTEHAHRYSDRKPPSVMHAFITKFFSPMSHLFGFDVLVERGMYESHMELDHCTFQHPRSTLSVCLAMVGTCGGMARPAEFLCT